MIKREKKIIFLTRCCLVSFIFMALIISGCEKGGSGNSGGDDFIQMVTVSGVNNFTIGNTDAENVSIVQTGINISSFKIGKYEITYAKWNEVRVWAVDSARGSNVYTFDNNGSGTTSEHPVTNINYRDVIAWCNALSEMEGLSPVYYYNDNTTVYRDSTDMTPDIVAFVTTDSNAYVKWSVNGYRLPTEVEWEYAARYISDSNFTSGNEHSGFNLDPDPEDCVWYNSIETHPVGQLQPNSLGLYDMSGNVIEYCWGWYYDYNDNPYAGQTDPRGPGVRDPGDTEYSRIAKGGACAGMYSYTKTSSRGIFNTWNVGDEYTGFRVVKGN